jgi:hypothetical protein
VTYGQDISVRAVLDTNKGMIGDQFKLRLLVEKPSDSWKVTFPVLDSLKNKIEVLKVMPVDTSATSHSQVLTQDLLITVFDTGFFEIPALPFGINNASFSDTIKSLPVIFEIQAMKSDSTIRDIKAIYKVPLSFREIAPYIIGIIALSLLLWLIIRYLRNRKVKETQKVVEVLSEPADVIALKELARLGEEKPWLNNRIKYYYSRISDILRTYIERRFQTLAMEQTTGEILLSLKNKHIETADLNRLTDILKLADLVKFAKVIPDPEQNALQIGYAGEFVRSTSRIAPEVTGEEIVESNTR